jgi:hypothetical protein
VASVEVNVAFVAVSIFERIWEETSCGLVLRGRCAGTGNAIGQEPRSESRVDNHVVRDEEQRASTLNS